MRDLEQRIQAWRQSQLTTRKLTVDEIDELEDHLHEKATAFVAAGRELNDAFEQATFELGSSEQLVDEFRKSRPSSFGDWRGLGGLGLVLFVLSYFLPTVEDFGTIIDSGTFPGVFAFQAAIEGEAGFFGIISALTNFVLLGSLFAFRATGRLLTVMTVAMAASTAWNAWWMVAADASLGLYVGYYLWWVSFATITLNLAYRRFRAPFRWLLTSN